MYKFGSLSLGAALAIVMALPQVSDAQYGFYYGGGGGTRVGVNIGTPFYGQYYGSQNYGGQYYGGQYSPWYGGYPSPTGSSWPSYPSNTYTNPYAYGSTYYPGTNYIAPATNYQQSYYPPMNQGNRTDNTATIEIVCPPDAELWFDGNQTQQRGANRIFVTPVLGEGKYFYEVRGTWKDQNGKEVTRTRQVQATPNQRAFVNLMEEPLRESIQQPGFQKQNINPLDIKKGG